MRSDKCEIFYFVVFVFEFVVLIFDLFYFFLFRDIKYNIVLGDDVIGFLFWVYINMVLV